MIENVGKNNLKNSIKNSRKPNLTELGIIYLTILVPIIHKEREDCLFASLILESLFFRITICVSH